MTFKEFSELRDKGSWGENMHPLLRALLIDATGDWDTAHSIAQDDPTSNGSWVHAYLHRKEGDKWNAGYWYDRAGRKMTGKKPEAEWDDIARALLPELS
ncbi:MAG: hypothetical protein K9J30_00615 [Bacteroidales bacterium]|nr:hypothetical protein [Bacteroidales bacterium]